MKKSGISMVIVITAVAIMMVLVSVASVVGTGAIETANYDEFISNVNRVADSVNVYYLQNGTLPITGDSVNISSLPDAFKLELKNKNDAANKLFVLDISLLNDSTIKNGTGGLNNQDVFVVAEDTHNVYYLRGFEYKSKIYYGV